MSILNKILFHLPPEAAHHLSLSGLNFLYQVGLLRPSERLQSPIKIMGLSFPNPMGIAAGLDKNADYIDALGALGFGFIEVGTVTPKAQLGNPKPRLFRLKSQKALINRMGFNNKGLDYVVTQLKKTKYKGILGINIGKNRDTSLEEAVDDYVLGFNTVAPYASYVTVNISSPNTPGLRELQHAQFLTQLLQELKQAQAQKNKYVPIVVKIAPDLSDDELNEMAEIFLKEKMDGVIATNTTINRDKIREALLAAEPGGLSGKPLSQLSTNMVRKLHNLLGDAIPIIGCGGVFSSKDATEKMNAGASLVQVYTGLVYRGFDLVKDLLNRRAN